MWDMSEEDRIAVALFGERAQLDPRSLLGLPASDADREAAAPQGNGNSSRIDGPIVMGPSQALDDVLRKVQSRRVQMTAIRCGGSIDEQIPVPPAGLNDLIFRLSPGHRVAPVGLLVAIARYPDLEIAAVFACECPGRGPQRLPWSLQEGMGGTGTILQERARQARSERALTDREPPNETSGQDRM
jgi:hypothetical protein